MIDPTLVPPTMTTDTTPAVPPVTPAPPAPPVAIPVAAVPVAPVPRAPAAAPRFPGWVAMVFGMAISLAGTTGASYVLPLVMPHAKAKAVITPVSEIAAGPVLFTGVKSAVAHKFIWTPPAGCNPRVFGPHGESIMFDLPEKGAVKLGLTVRSANGGNLTEDTIVIDVEAGKPLPGPQPQPNPPGPVPPAPPSPPAPQGLGVWAKSEVEKFMASRSARVTEAKAVAAGIRAACEAKDGTIVDLENDIIGEMDKRLSDEASGPWSKFGDAAFAKLREKYGILALAPVADVKVGLLEIAAGLESVQ